MEIETALETQSNATEIINFITNTTTLWSFFGIIAIIVLSILFLVCLKINLNRDSSKQIGIFSRDRKYIKSIYIELNETQEMLRYFAFATRWKKRIIKLFNDLFKNSEGENLRKKLKVDRFRISKFIRKKNLDGKLKKYFLFFDNFRQQREEEFRERLGDYSFKIEHLAYTYSNKIQLLNAKNKMMLSKEVLLVGNAGNGKTTLLCDFANLLIRNNFPCMFINAKDIRNKDCFDYFISRLKMPNMLKTNYSIYLTLANCLLAISRKHLFVVIDAINENDNPEFKDSLSELINQLSKYKRFRIIMSCRAEYYNARYKQFFESTYIPLNVVNIHDHNYTLRSKEHILTKYAEYFNFSGRITSYAKHKMFRSLLLMRIFFEVYENRSDNIIDLNNYAIYQEYIHQLSTQNGRLDISKIVNGIVKKMIEENEYGGVEINDIILDQNEREQLEKLFDNNFLIAKTYIINEGLITENTTEKIYFVFDDLRDFCISKYLLSIGETSNFAKLFEVCDELWEERKSPLEGILKFSYIYFKKQENYELCKLILDKYCSDNIHFWKYEESGRRLEEENELFDSFGLSLIFNETENVKDFEKEYLFSAIKDNCHDFWQMLFYFLSNEREGFAPGCEFVVDIITMFNDIEDVENLFEYYARQTTSYYFDETEKISNQLYEAIKYIYDENKVLTISVKQILLLIVAMIRSEDLFDDFIEEIVREGEALEQLVTAINVPELIDRLQQVEQIYTF